MISFDGEILSGGRSIQASVLGSNHTVSEALSNDVNADNAAVGCRKIDDLSQPKPDIQMSACNPQVVQEFNSSVLKSLFTLCLSSVVNLVSYSRNFKVVRFTSVLSDTDVESLSIKRSN